MKEQSGKNDREAEYQRDTISLIVIDLQPSVTFAPFDITASVCHGTTDT